MVVIVDEESYFTNFICNYHKCMTFGCMGIMYSTVFRRFSCNMDKSEDLRAAKVATLINLTGNISFATWYKNMN